MFAYNPEKFASLFASPIGQRLWAFLTQPDNVARLETASELGKPAVEGIEEQLLAEFREDVLTHRVKQLAGHMVRQIMEQREWVLDQTDVKVRSVPFIKATRYRRPDWSTFHAFRNTSDPRDVVITDRRQNPTLPTDSRWTFYTTFASPLKAAVAFGVRDIRHLRQQVHSHGYHRVRMEPILRRYDGGDLTITNLPATTVAAADFYDKHYVELDEPIFLEPGKKQILGSAERPRHCRFCGKDEPEVTFKHEAHAVPAAFGNTGLFSNYECDACNHLFGGGIENDLGHWTKPMRTLSRIKGRSGVPTIKKPGPENGWRIEYSGTGFQMKEYEGQPFFEVDEEAKQLRFELHRDTYIPVAALKGLVKVGLTLIPDVETQHFRETYEWIRDTDHSRNFVAKFPVFRTFIPGPMPSNRIVLVLMRRRADIDTVPYAFFTFAYGNHALQVFLPSISQDKCIDGKPLSLPPYPTPEARDPARYGRPSVRVEHLTGRQPVKGEMVPVVFGFDYVEKTTSEDTSDAA